MRALFVGGAGPVGQAAVCAPARGGPRHSCLIASPWIGSAARSPPPLERAPAGMWARNVADARELAFGGDAAPVAARLNWEWELEELAWTDGDHPSNARHPVLADTTRLRAALG